MENNMTLKTNPEARAEVKVVTQSTFIYDGSEGIAFWVNDTKNDPELEHTIAVSFDDLEELDAFLLKHFPGAPRGHWNEEKALGAVVNQGVDMISVTDLRHREVAISLANGNVDKAREILAFLTGSNPERKPPYDGTPGNEGLFQ